MLNISVIRRQRTIPSLMFTLENILIVQRLNHLLSHLSVVADSRFTLWNYLTLKKKSFCHPIWGVLVTVCCLSTKILTLFSSELRITKLFSGMIWICKKKIESKCEIHVSKIFQLKYHLSHGKDESSKYAYMCPVSIWEAQVGILSKPDFFKVISWNCSTCNPPTKIISLLIIIRRSNKSYFIIKLWYIFLCISTAGKRFV